MIKANFVTAREAAAMVKDGDTVCTVGMTLVSASESILKALEKDFIETGHPCGMTLLHSCGQSDRKDGIQHFAHEGMIKRIIGFTLGTSAQVDGNDCWQPGGGILPSPGADCSALSQHGLWPSR